MKRVAGTNRVGKMVTDDGESIIARTINITRTINTPSSRLTHRGITTAVRFYDAV
jgi:hypothetical protein